MYDKETMPTLTLTIAETFPLCARLIYRVARRTYL